MPALHRFLNAELDRRLWSVEQFAERAQLSLSNAYLILRDGKDNVRQNTFDNIAAALSMTPAELATAIGKGSTSDDNPQLATVHALLRQVESNDLTTIEKIVRAFTPVKPHPGDPAKPRRGRPSIHSSTGDSDPDNTLRPRYRRPHKGLTLLAA